MNPLEAAHGAVQDRKEATGMPELVDVLAGSAEVPYKGGHLGMWAGTDLSEEQAFEAAQICARAVAQLLISGDADVMQVLTATYIEGLLVGIEHGRKLGS